MVTLIIQKKKTWLGETKYHCHIKHLNGNVLFYSEKQHNLKDLEEMLANLQRDLGKAKIVYDFDTSNLRD
jgi:hypothetical protein